MHAVNPAGNQLAEYEYVLGEIIEKIQFNHQL